jgi:hypothetical protein
MFQTHHVPAASAMGPAFKQARMHVYQAGAPVQLHRSQSDAAQLPPSHGFSSNSTYGGASQPSLATLRKDFPRKQSAAYPAPQEGRTGSIGAKKN